MHGIHAGSVKTAQVDESQGTAAAEIIAENKLSPSIMRVHVSGQKFASGKKYGVNGLFVSFPGVGKGIFLIAFVEYGKLFCVYKKMNSVM